MDGASGKRNVRINGVTAKSQVALSDYLSCIWLTPQMDRLFLDTAGGRRRFFDKLIFAFDPTHAGRVTRYENAMAQRSKLLREGGADPVWLKGLEAQMAETGIAVAAARLDFCGRLQRACDTAHERQETFFPKAKLHLSGTVEELLSKTPAVEVEEMFAYQLQQSRPHDAETGGAATGPHKGDLQVKYAAKNMPADQCSTGEQKALLIGIILAHSRLMAAERGSPPILLLDEVAAHLDENRRAALFDLLSDLGGQVWMTGTDISLFSAAQKRAQFWSVQDACIEKM
jgi:DNA replication and repair protein RecF